MAELVDQLKRRGKEAAERVNEARAEAQDAVSEPLKRQAPDVAGGGDDVERDARAQRAGGASLTRELKDTAREAAIEVLKPVMRKATVSAGKYAVMQGPRLLNDRVAPRVRDAGGVGALAKGVAGKGGGLGGTVGGVVSAIGGKLGGGRQREREAPSGTGRGRRLPVEESIDVGVDLQTAYDEFTQFEGWPRFMHRVERIEQRDESTLMWHENIWGVRRSWEAEITDQAPCERIAWRSRGGPQTVGVVTFHRLSDRLTRILITIDFQPKGPFEKAASGMRLSRRALKSDLMRFKAFVELRDEATGGWGGRIEDGEVVGEDGVDSGAADEREERDEDVEDAYEEEDEEGEPRAFQEEEDDEEAAPRASQEEEQYEDEDDAVASEEDEEEVEPLRPRRRRSRARAGGSAAGGR